MKKIFVFGLLAAVGAITMLLPAQADTRYCRNNSTDVLCMEPNITHGTYHHRMMNSDDYRRHHRMFHRMHNMAY